MKAEKTILVIGAGIVGAVTSHRLAQAGYRVTLCDRDPPGGEGAASFGNGGWISPASIIPMSGPGLWKKVPGYLLDRDGPLTIDWSSLPRLAPWLLRFLMAGFTEKRVRRIAGKLNLLLADAPERHKALAAAAGHPELVVQKGLLYAYPSREAFEAEGLSWKLRRENDVAVEEWDEATLRSRLGALGANFRFGAYVRDGAHCINTGRYVAAIVAAAQALGVEFRKGSVSAILGGSSPRAVMDDGTSIAADHIVVATGVRSTGLVRPLGIRIPMESERGYHVTVSAEPTPFDIPVMPSTGKMANTPTEMGLRLSGQVELASTDKAPNWRRAEILRNHAWTSYPYLTAKNPKDLKMWMGHRPSTPDGMPVIGAFAREPSIIAAFGHGHIGIASAPKTAELVLAALESRMPEEAAAFGPARFGA